MHTTSTLQALIVMTSTPVSDLAPGMRARVAAFDWHATALGPRLDWPASLAAVVTLVLDSVEPMVVWWGDASLQIYNDAYAPRVDAAGASALGQPAGHHWRHGWATIAPLVRRVLDGGPATAYTDFLYCIERGDWIEDTWWAVAFTPVRDDSGRPCGVLVHSRETTESRLVLRRQQTLDLLRHALASAGTTQALDAAVKQAVANDPDDLQGVALLALHAVLPSRGTALYVAAPDVGVDVDLALAFTRGARVADTAVYRLFLEQFTLLVASARRRIDADALRLAVEAERDRLLLDAPVGAAVMIGADLVYHLVNAIYAMVSGRTADSMVGRPFTDVFPELDGAPVHEKFKEVYRAGEPFVSQPTLVRIHRHGGALDDRYFTYNLSPLRTLAGEVYGLMVIAVDITVEVVSRAEVEQLNVDLQQAARAKDEFLALLGHELRNPLAPIVTALDLMRLRDHATGREQVVIRRQVTHLTRLVDDLLDVSRITRGKVELRKEAVAARDVLLAAVEMVTPLIDQRRQQLHVEIVPVTWYGDPARLAQIVSNLLTNASRYSQAGADIALHAMVAGDTFVIEVTDNGTGVAPGLLPHIFEPFIQGERTLHAAVGGLGIGLALVKNLTELHGGTVVAQSAGRGQGSRFTVRLPLAAAILAPQPPAVSGSSVSGAPQRILVVDDNVDAADTLADILRVHGHAVAVAYTPDAALELFAGQAFDCAVLDIGLPGMSGHELATYMRRTGCNPGVRYVALSGFGQEADRQRSADAGFAAHLVKPLAPDALGSLLGM
jgi:PAS domain S-box-containing protein